MIPPMEVTAIEIMWFFILSIYATFVTLGTKFSYELMRKKGFEQNVAVYYNRKIIHMFAGGVVVLFVPYLFNSPWMPLFAGIVLTIFTYIPHKTGKILYWFQTEENLNDVNFCLMWALTVFFIWILVDTPWIAIIPPLFMAFGDGVTGVVRNAVFKKRTKHPIGNVFMVFVCIPLGFYFAGMASPSLTWWGVLAAVVASFVERYEFGPIDDNILITLSSTIILLIGFFSTPIM
jgi:hypothetical protein